MNEQLLKSFSEQINKEYFSAYLYLAMSNWLNDRGLKGAAKWTYVQYQEELAHAQNLFHYLQYRDVSAGFQAIADPSGNWDNELAVFQHILAHEKMVTDSISKLASLALKADDHAAYIFLQWYVTEQVEEEGNATDIIQKLTLAGDNGSALLAIDSQLGTRVFAAPVVPGLPAGL
ncbi:MAG TPA: ferritin [Clostridiales bacterium]|nr:ferritin [Clostridiales bacterium]